MTEKKVQPRRKTLGQLTHDDFGCKVSIAGFPSGTLWAVHHVAAIGDIPEPWTRVTLRRDRGSGFSEATRGLAPETPVEVWPKSSATPCLVAANFSGGSVGDKPA